MKRYVINRIYHNIYKKISLVSKHIIYNHIVRAKLYFKYRIYPKL